jgi:hypothetical protein
MQPLLLSTIEIVVMKMALASRPLSGSQPRKFTEAESLGLIIYGNFSRIFSKFRCLAQAQMTQAVPRVAALCCCTQQTLL